MALIPVQIPAGIFRVGTEYEQSGRWRDGNLVRWEGSSLRPVGGWYTRKDISSSVSVAPRKMHTWVDSDGDSRIVVGTASELLHVTAGGTVADITPASYTAGDEDAQINTGFGGKFFGIGLFGVRRTGDGTPKEADTWSLDNWGDYLVACSTSDGRILEWQLDTALDAAVLTNAPTDCKGLLVTEERFIFALQADGDKRKIAWCDREDNTTWTAADTNEAGDILLQTSGEIMCAARMRGRSIILTSTDAHIATYQGPPYVYGFERVGTSCGVVSRNSLVSVNEGAFWMGDDAFFMFDGSTARKMQCDVADYVFEGINKDQSSKISAVHNNEYNEVWWFYPSADSLECDRYVAFNYTDNTWTIGEIDRTCGVDSGVFTDPIWISSTGVLYNHEIRNGGHGSQTPFAETGPISIGAGDSVMKVNQVYTDEAVAGDVELTFKARFHPNDIERSYGPYAIDTHPTSVRFTGRQIRMRVEATNNNDFRVGVMRMNVETGGRR